MCRLIFFKLLKDFFDHLQRNFTEINSRQSKLLHVVVIPDSLEDGGDLACVQLCRGQIEEGQGGGGYDCNHQRDVNV